VDRVGENVGECTANTVVSFKGDNEGKDTKIVKEKTTKKTTEKIIRLVAKNRQIAAPEMAKEIGVTICSVERNIGQLKNKVCSSESDPTKAVTGR
jgi:predicted HTH transcriptional regulator